MCSFSSSCVSLQFSVNGLFSFGKPEERFFPSNFPTDNIIIAPFWADVDLRNGGGMVQYGLSRGSDQILEKEINDVTFNPTYYIFAKWINVGYYDRNKFTNRLMLVSFSDAVLCPVRWLVQGEKAEL